MSSADAGMLEERYVATTQLMMHSGPAGLVSVAAGEPVEQFSQMPFVVRDALLRTGKVRRDGLRYTANLSTTGGYLHFGTSAELEAAAPVPTPAPAPLPAAPPPSVQLPTLQAQMAAEEVAAAADVAVAVAEPAPAPRRRGRPRRVEP